MLDNALVKLIIQTLNGGFQQLEALVPKPPKVKQSFQPVQQGANSDPTIYLYKIGPDTRMGWPSQETFWDQDAEKEYITQTTQYMSRFQLSCLATQDPKNVNALTASDLLNYAAFIMQKQSTIEAFEALGCGLLNVSQVRNPPFVDDRDRFEFIPSFDFVVTHKQIITLETKVVTETIVQVLSVPNNP